MTKKLSDLGVLHVHAPGQGDEGLADLAAFLADPAGDPASLVLIACLAMVLVGLLLRAVARV